MDIRTLIKDRLEEYEAELFRENRKRQRAAQLKARHAEYKNVLRELAKPRSLSAYNYHTLITRKTELETLLGIVTVPYKAEGA